ncbi:histone-lysine N-methyltransferase SETMAR [Nephila pilipes]|uniref:Histone-lysine N-methyltransferase SETMAR n=1 Tax=Nephila pilipes TaxID=299642 RepID=A0A8X6P7P6_NEPPI|nr:histone-lysine N-methyltransferase SETMAR [Nephila pilipes]
MEASGLPSSSRTDINTARVEEIIQRDRRVTVPDIASELEMSYGNVQRIVTDELRYSKRKLIRTLILRRCSENSSEKWLRNDQSPITPELNIRRPSENATIAGLGTIN